MLRHKPSLSIRLVLPALLACGAVHADYLDDLNALYGQGKPLDAYLLGQQHLLEGEGDPRFDYPYGLAAVDAGFIGEGVFALERYLQSRPEDLRARLELARGFYYLEQYDRARDEFDRVLAAQPPEQVRENVERFLDLIRHRESRYRTTTGYFLEVGAGYDSNINNAPKDDSFYAPAIGAGEIAAESLAEEDGFLDLAAGATLTHPMAPGLALFLGGDGYYKLNWDASGFDMGALNLKTGLSWLHQNDSLRLTLHGQRYTLDNDLYREMFAVAGEWRHRLDAYTQLTGFLSWADLGYPDNERRDSELTTLGIGGSRLFAGPLRPQIYGSLYGGQERASRDDPDAETLVDRNLFGVRLGVQVNPLPKVSVDLTGQWQRSDYQNEDYLFLRARADDYWNLELGATWLFARHWSLRGSLGYSENDSNIPVNDYDRANARLSVRYEY